MLQTSGFLDLAFGIARSSQHVQRSRGIWNTAQSDLEIFETPPHVIHGIQRLRAATASAASISLTMQPRVPDVGLYGVWPNSPVYEPSACAEQHDGLTSPKTGSGCRLPQSDT
jgi:hypothetical protein